MFTCFFYKRILLSRSWHPGLQELKVKREGNKSLLQNGRKLITKCLRAKTCNTYSSQTNASTSLMNDDNIRGNSLDEPNDCFAPINGVTGETEVD